jgi:predicted DNA-binding transcriptional regulator YafY
VGIVAPHALWIAAPRYRVAPDLSKADAPLQHYRVEDIEAGEVLAESFEFDAGFDIRDHARRGFASFVNDEEHGEVLWRFKPHAAAHARRYLFHPTQVLQEEPDGSLLVRFEASGHLEMCWHLYAWGDAVEVLAPEALRRMVDGFRRSDFPALP